jgi:O-antigen/teichoic acid export membrane protein
MTGTMLSQGIPMAVLLVLTRIVPAIEIGSFSLLLSTANISSILVAASFDKAFFSATTEKEIIEILRLTTIFGCTIGLIITREHPTFYSIERDKAFVLVCQ